MLEIPKPLEHTGREAAGTVKCEQWAAGEAAGGQRARRLLFDVGVPLAVAAVRLDAAEAGTGPEAKGFGVGTKDSAAPRAGSVSNDRLD